MAHEISIRSNGFAEIAFAGETPWHNLGQKIERGASIEEWKKAAGMDWAINSSPVEFAPVDGNGTRREFTGNYVLHRSDTGAPLSVVSSRYHAVQPTEVVEFFQHFVDEFGFQIEVAGTLRGGRKLWAIANTGKFAEVSNGDGVGGFLLLSTSCDKSIATTARFTSIRVVCNNTLTMALNDNAPAVVSFSHLSKFNADVMRGKLQQTVSSFGAFIDAAKTLRSMQMNTAQANAFVAKLVAPPLSRMPADAKPIEENRNFQKIMALFDGGARGSDMAGHTRWGMLNAVTQFVDHDCATRSDDARLNSAWFGRGDRTKDAALAALLQAA